MSEIVVQSEFMRQAYNRGDTIKKIGNNKYKCVALICNEPTINEHVYSDQLVRKFIEPIDTVSGRILHYLCEETVIGNTGCSSIVIRTGAIGDISNDNKITFIESMCFYADFYYSAIPAHQA